MAAEVSPEPAEDEREAILAALDAVGAEPTAGDESLWQRAARQEAVEGLDP